MEWMDTLKECIQEEVLNTYSEIFYLNSTPFLSLSELDKIIEEQEIVSLLSSDSADINSDLLDFFLLKKDNQSDLFVILSPFDLWEEDVLFKVHKNINGSFDSLSTLEKIK